MKMTQEHFMQLKSLIADEITPYIIGRYRNLDIPRAESVKDINVRFRWDLYYHFAAKIMRDQFDYLDDNHIDTALHQIVPNISK